VFQFSPLADEPGVVRVERCVPRAAGWVSPAEQRAWLPGARAERVLLWVEPPAFPKALQRAARPGAQRASQSLEPTGYDLALRSGAPLALPQPRERELPVQSVCLPELAVPRQQSPAAHG